jgi:hypothetical protein
VLSLASWRQWTTPELSTYAPWLAVLMVVEVIALFAWSTYGSVVAVLFLKRRRSFPFHFTAYAIGIAAYTLLDHLAASLLAPQSSQSTIPAGARVLIWALVWASYVHRSRRVAVTFVQAPPRRKSKRSTGRT